jgi:hypothetical protein
MARTRRLWISDVAENAARLRFPVIMLGQEARARAGFAPFPAVWIAPTLAGPQLFVGVCYADADEIAAVEAEATARGIRFRHLPCRAADLDVTLTTAQRNAINQLLTGTTVPLLAAGETRRQALRRLMRALDPGAQEARELLRLTSHSWTAPIDVEG